jgi:N-acetylglucosaminyldiphosphoundecaprenol N-acetyl-beta-D-mannosaminyltransferase
MKYLNDVQINFYDKEFQADFKTNNLKFLVTLNSEVLLFTQKNQKFKNIINDKNTIVTIDGQWILFALKRKYGNIHLVKNSGSDLIYSIADEVAHHNQRLLILGSSEDSNKKAVEKLQELTGYKNIFGYSPPFSNYPFSEEFNHKTRDIISEIKPNIIILAFGVPKQEFWAEENREFLENMGVKYITFFGGAVDMVAGKVKRAPKILQKLGLEGIYRVILEPHRLKRFIKTLKIIPMILFNKL